jgi:uncharacterized protein
MVDRLTATILELGRQDSSQLNELPDTRRRYLASRGYLTEASLHEERRQLKAVASQAAAKRRRPRFYIMPTLECNLRCSYCFEHRLRKMARKQSLLNVRLTRARIELAFRAMNALCSQEHPRSVTLYGGEALMPDNRTCIETILQIAQRDNWSVMAATHGRNVDEFLDLLGPFGIRALHVPLDGPRETHDRLRFGPGRVPTFDAIIENIDKALRVGTQVRVRVNVTRDVLEQLPALVRVFEAHGFLGSPLFSAYVNPVYWPAGKGLSDQQVGESEIAQRLAGSDELACVFDGYPVVMQKIFALFSEDLAQALDPTHCCGGGGTYIFDPLGRIYPCNFIAGEQGSEIGRYDPQLEWYGPTLAQWKRRSIGELPEGHDCKYALFCGGGSPHEALHGAGTISAKSCDCSDFAQTFAGYVLAAFRRMSPRRYAVPGV